MHTCTHPPYTHTTYSSHASIKNKARHPHKITKRHLEPSCKPQNTTTTATTHATTAIATTNLHLQPEGGSVHSPIHGWDSGKFERQDLNRVKSTTTIIVPTLTTHSHEAHTHTHSLTHSLNTPTTYELISSHATSQTTQRHQHPSHSNEPAKANPCVDRR